jgi:hypothetical protein
MLVFFGLKEWREGVKDEDSGSSTRAREAGWISYRFAGVFWCSTRARGGQKLPKNPKIFLAAMRASEPGWNSFIRYTRGR